MNLQIAVNRVNPVTLETEQIAMFTMNEDDLSGVVFQRFPDIVALGQVQEALSAAIKKAWDQLGKEVKIEGKIRKDAADARKKWEETMAAVDPDVLPQEVNTPEKREKWLKMRGTRRFNDGGVALRKQLEEEEKNASA